MRRPAIRLAGPGLMLGLAACQNSLIFTTSSLFGVELNAVEGGQQTVKVGYQRVEGVRMPVTREDDELREEAYSVLSVVEIDSGPLLLGNLQTTTIRQVFATGHAAANAYDTVNQAFVALHAGETTPLTGEERTDARKAFARDARKAAGLWGTIRDSGDDAAVVAALEQIRELVPDAGPGMDTRRLRALPFSEENARKMKKLIPALQALADDLDSL